MTAASLSAAAARNRCSGSKRAVWIMAAALALAVVAGGCIPAPGMQNCFYVLLPYLGEVVAAASVVWALAKLGTDWREVREYNYEKALPFCRANRGRRRFCSARHRVRRDLLFHQ